MSKKHKMEKLRIKSTVQPDKKLDYNQWCKKYGVGRQYYKNVYSPFSLHDYNFSNDKKNTPDTFLTRLINFLLPS